MNNISKEYVLELTNLYDIKINENSNEHLMEDINGNIFKFSKKDIKNLIKSEVKK